MKLLDRILKRASKTKEDRVKELVKKLVNEIDFYHNDNGNIKSAHIYFDYRHLETRRIRIDCDRFHLDIDTKEPNRNFKK